MTDLFPETKPPRKRPQKLMRVYDAGDAGSGHDVVFQCWRCAYKSPWTPVKNTTEAKRGIPCPKCNGAEDKAMIAAMIKGDDHENRR